MLLTPDQLDEIKQIIADHHTAFVASIISPDVVPVEVLERLKAMGLVDVEATSISDAYLYGQVLGSLESARGMSYEQFREHIRKKPVALTAIEKGAIDAAQRHAAQYAHGLGNRVDQSTGEILHDIDADLRRQMRGEIRDATAENIARRESIKKLKSNLGWATGDWSRDWDRIAQTEKHAAMERGQADYIAKRYGEDARVFVRPASDACHLCKRLYLGPDGNPRIFKLSMLEENGSNYGRKAADALPVVPPAHPRCRDRLQRMPAGWGFDEDGRLSPKGKGGIEYDDNADLSLAMDQEGDLRKAFRLQGHAEFQGIPIAIENKPGSVRKWRDQDGHEGETHMRFAYGYIEGAMGDDGDELDVYLGPDPRAPVVYIVHQEGERDGRYDENKVFLGFSTQALAEDAYREHYDQAGAVLNASSMDVAAFKRWLKAVDLTPTEVVDGPKLVVLGEPMEKADYAGILRDPSRPVVSVGKRGGKIYGYDSRGRPIYDPGKKARTGSIALSNEVVTKLADRLLANTKATRQGIIPGSPVEGEAIHYLRDPSGKKVRVRMRLSPGKVSDPRGVTGVAKNAVVMGEGGKSELNEVLVEVRVNDHTGQDKDDLSRAVRDVLSHEITHALDPSLTKRSEGKTMSQLAAKKTGTAYAHGEAEERYREYLNRKEEVTASIQQIVRDLTDKRIVTELLRDAKAHDENPDSPEPMGPQELLDLGYSGRWKRVSGYYTPENRKRVMKAVAQLRDAIISGRVQGIKKSQDPMEKARVEAAFGAAGSPAGGRAPGQSSGANFVSQTPIAVSRPARVDPQMLGLKDPGKREVKIKLDSMTLEVNEPQHREPQTMVVLLPGDERDPEEARRERKKLDDARRATVGAKNQQPVEA